MTVGMAAIADARTENPKVVVAADTLLTTQQQSAIEHEHPETKLGRIASSYNNVEILSVCAGAVSLAEKLSKKIEDVLPQAVEQGIPITVENVAELAAEQYRQLIQDQIHKRVLSSYGLSLEDMSKQHQFKDDFFNDVWTQARELEQQIMQNLVMLIGGLDQTGAAVYEIGNNDITGHNDIGYAVIGSGSQPAQSEFIKSKYGKSDDFDTCVATATAANFRAEQARGVGGDMHMGVVSAHGTKFVNSDTVEALIDRQREIAEEQERVKQKTLDSNSIDLGISL